MPILWAIVSWIFREVIVRFVLMAAIYAVITVLIPILLNFILPFLGVGSLTGSFSLISPQVWFFLDVARLDYGLPLILSAAVSTFIIRRIPIVGS
jgi:hypothetical protein